MRRDLVSEEDDRESEMSPDLESSVFEAEKTQKVVSSTRADADRRTGEDEVSLGKKGLKHRNKKMEVFFEHMCSLSTFGNRRCWTWCGLSGQLSVVTVDRGSRAAARP